MENNLEILNPEVMIHKMVRQYGNMTRVFAPILMKKKLF